MFHVDALRRRPFAAGSASAGGGLAEERGAGMAGRCELEAMCRGGGKCASRMWL